MVNRCQRNEIEVTFSAFFYNVKILKSTKIRLLRSTSTINGMNNRSLARPRTGTQTIERAATLLRRLAGRGEIGWRLSDLANACGFDIGTTHRILNSLVRERLASQRMRDRHYLAGPLLFELSLSTTRFSTFQIACQPSLETVAKQAKCVVFLYLLSGPEVVMAARAGEIPNKLLSTMNIGTRRLLIMLSPGIAILLRLPRNERNRLIAENMQQIRHFDRARITAVKSMMNRSKEFGFGLDEGKIVPGVTALGVPLVDQFGFPFAGVSVAGPEGRLAPSRYSAIIRILESAARDMEVLAHRLIVDGHEVKQRRTSADF